MVQAEGCLGSTSESKIHIQWILRMLFNIGIKVVKVTDLEFYV